MGSRDITASIQVVTLNYRVPLKKGRIANSWESDHEKSYIESYFEEYSADNDCVISWSGVKLAPNEGWHSMGGGSLFVRSRFGLNPFNPIREFRDDVETKKKNVFTYNNGYKIGSKWDAGIYHIVFPYSFVPFQILYPSMGDIEIVHCRIMEGRAIITWVFKKQIQFKISMRHTEPDSKDLSQENLYMVTAENMPAEVIAKSEFLKDIKKGAVSNILSNIPKIFSAI